MNAMWRWVVVIGWAWALVGCERVSELTLSRDGKVTAAYPLPPEVRVAQEGLLNRLANDANGAQALKAQIDAQLQIRALTCSAGRDIGRFTSVASVRGMGLDRDCFAKQDQELQRFLGLRTLGLVLAQPPLQPLPQSSGWVALEGQGQGRARAIAPASQAGVALVVDAEGQARLVSLARGETVSTMSAPRVFGSGGWKLSPNGRIAAMPREGTGPLFFDTESGRELWALPAPETSQLLTWVPKDQGFVLRSRRGELSIADGQTGKLEPYPSALKFQEYSAPQALGDGRLVVGTADAVTVIGHQRQERGIVPTVLKSHPATGLRQRVFQEPAVVLRHGRQLVRNGGGPLGWFDLDSGESGTWDIEIPYGAQLAKLDETRLLLGGQDPATRTPALWVFDTEARTVARLKPNAPTGQVVGGLDRGFFLLGGAAWYAPAVETEAPVALEEFTAAQNLAHQLQRLQSLAQSAEAQGGAAPMASRVDAPAPMATVPGLQGVPTDAPVHIVGVYEGKTSKGRQEGVLPEVQVALTHRGKPIVLVLSSYEAVRWRLQGAPGRVVAVLLSGYKTSLVEGLTGVPILRIGTSYAYAPGSAEYAQLQADVRRYVGTRPIASFQGAYAGSQFSVSGP